MTHLVAAMYLCGFHSLFLQEIPCLHGVILSNKYIHSIWHNANPIEPHIIHIIPAVQPCPQPLLSAPLRSQSDRQKWILDEMAAPIVKRLYLGTISGKSPTQLANELSSEGILTPSAHWNNIGAGMPGKSNANPTTWSVTTVINILDKEEYMVFPPTSNALK